MSYKTKRITFRLTMLQHMKMEKMFGKVTHRLGHRGVSNWTELCIAALERLYDETFPVGPSNYPPPVKNGPPPYPMGEGVPTIRDGKPVKRTYPTSKTIK